MVRLAAAEARYSSVLARPEADQHSAGYKKSASDAAADPRRR
jgi:hypothetical protein